MTTRLPSRRLCGFSLSLVLAAAGGSQIGLSEASGQNTGKPINTPAELIQRLNETDAVKGTDDVKSYPGIFDAYLELSAPPMAIDAAFNLTMIHPGMDEWATVSGWAESNSAMADAINAAAEQTLFGLPYGASNVASKYRDAGLMAEVAEDGNARVARFPYLDAIDVIAAFATAESYRRFEAGDIDGGLDIIVDFAFVLRQCCDREFVDEQSYSISLLSETLGNLRDMYHVYYDVIPSDAYVKVSSERLPFLRPDRSRLLMPEGDRLAAEVILRDVFDRQGQPNPSRFAEIFAQVQADEEPLTLIGAAKRWRLIAEVHDSEESSLERLKRVYDDWWRRWRVEDFDPILGVKSEFDQTNPIRFAAVLYSIENIQALFETRNVLRADVGGTIMAGAICGFQKRFGNPAQVNDNLYAIAMRKYSDRDPFDKDFGVFKYRVLEDDFETDTPYGRVRIDEGTAFCWSKGQDYRDDRGEKHFDDGAEGDIVYWPPMRALEREQGLRP